MLAGSSFFLEVIVTDEFGNPITAALVTFEVESGGGTLSSSAAHTDSVGVARVDFTVGTAGQQTITASVVGLEPARFTATILEAPVYYELEPLSGWLTPRSSWIALGDGNSFATSVDGITGSGTYSLSGNTIALTYTTDFLHRLGAAMDWWAYPYSFERETGSFVSDRIVLRRCWGEDCYEASWSFHRTESPTEDGP